MKYWEMVVDEVEQKEDVPHVFSLTNIKLYKQALKEKAMQRAAEAKKGDSKRRKYYLGDNFPNVYFTKMELNTMAHLYNGRTTLEIAQALSLSKRTIEYYIKNMKDKIKCRYSTELVTKVAQTDLIELIRRGVVENKE
jgi:DNA-binding CsgD family transcriptional regulator